MSIARWSRSCRTRQVRETHVFEASVAVPFLRVGVFDAQNLVTIPHAKLIRVLGKLSAAQLAVVERATIIWLGLSLTTSSEV
jgi:mRNA interferase MazF